MNKVTQKTDNFRLHDLGLIAYQDAYRIQQEIIKKVYDGSWPHTLIFCEHPPILTLGRLATERNFLYSKEEIENKGVQIERIDRGGEVTFHGPGQLVMYPILKLENLGKDLKVYLHKLEQVAIDLLLNFGIVADRIPGQRGVWVGREKIASIGIGVRKWVSFHGMALNVNTDMKYFALVKPCGLNVLMTSIAKLKNREIPMTDVKKETIKAFSKVFGLTAIEGEGDD